MQTLRLYVLHNQSYCQSKFYIEGNGILDQFCSHDVDLAPMTLTYKVDLNPLEIYWMCENELSTSRL